MSEDDGPARRLKEDESVIDVLHGIAGIDDDLLAVGGDILSNIVLHDDMILDDNLLLRSLRMAGHLRLPDAAIFADELSRRWRDDAERCAGLLEAVEELLGPFEQSAEAVLIFELFGES